MGELGQLLQQVQENKEKFFLVIDKMEPLIRKYTRLLYKDEKDDVRSELVLALWEAVLRLEYIENDGRCTVYLSNALRNKFLELYRKSRKQHDNQSTLEIGAIEEIASGEEEKLSQILLEEDLMRIVEHFNALKKQICYSIIFEELSDAEVAKKYQISRQYSNRVRREFYLKIKQIYL